MVYEKIKAICDEKHISISELEKKAGLGNSTIRRWQTASPSVDNLKLVARILEVDVVQLIQ